MRFIPSKKNTNLETLDLIDSKASGLADLLEVDVGVRVGLGHGGVVAGGGWSLHWGYLGTILLSRDTGAGRPSSPLLGQAWLQPKAPGI